MQRGSSRTSCGTWERPWLSWSLSSLSSPENDLHDIKCIIFPCYILFYLSSYLICLFGVKHKLLCIGIIVWLVFGLRPIHPAKIRNQLFQRNNMHKVFTWARPGGSQGWRCSTGVRKPWWLQSCNPLPGIGTSLLEQGPAAPVWNCIIQRLWSTFAHLDHQPKGTGADFVLPDRITSSRVKPFVNTCTWGDWYDHLLRQIWSRGLPLSELASPTGTIQHNILGRPWPVCQFHSSKKSILQLKIIVQLPPFRRTEC